MIEGCNPIVFHLEIAQKQANHNPEPLSKKLHFRNTISQVTTTGVKMRKTMVYWVCLTLFTLSTTQPTFLPAAPWDPAAADYSGNRGKTLYVSKLGDNSDGGSWQKAFHTVQAALSAIPDDNGGHRVVIRPDTYMEDMLHGQAGAPGAYNLLVGDTDGSLGSGTTGRVVLDTSDPVEAPHKVIQLGKSKIVQSGSKYNDWRVLLRGDPVKHSAKIWDRWIIRNIYTAGSEGLNWECGLHPGMELSVVVENCVGFGRFAGAGVMNFTGRKNEPVVFRGCHFFCLDWWADAGGVYVRANRESMPDFPDVIFEDCTITGVDNAVQVGYPGYTGYTRIKFKNCRLVSLNFSIPEGTPTSGVICCDTEGKYLHVDLEDCILVGGKVFGKSDPAIQHTSNPPPEGEISYAVKGKVAAYVCDKQKVPEGFERLGRWPVDVFDDLLPRESCKDQPVTDK